MLCFIYNPQVQFSPWSLGFQMWSRQCSRRHETTRFNHGISRLYCVRTYPSEVRRHSWSVLARNAQPANGAASRTTIMSHHASCIMHIMTRRAPTVPTARRTHAMWCHENNHQCTAFCLYLSPMVRKAVCEIHSSFHLSFCFLLPGTGVWYWRFHRNQKPQPAQYYESKLPIPFSFN